MNHLLRTSKYTYDLLFKIKILNYLLHRQTILLLSGDFLLQISAFFLLFLGNLFFAA